MFFQPGDSVEVLDGPYEGATGTVGITRTDNGMVEVKGLIGWFAEAFSSLPQIHPDDLALIEPAC
ncbi:hypothetical protein [Kitasatospora sp. NPDC088134]|uniref:hypothetical protein n=1 Tax=Kitasatospora sp. NPDC088134 TaxID=3364071 RepID=UPI0038211262